MMQLKKLTIPVQIGEDTVEIHVYAENATAVLIEKSDALENGEAYFQIREGCYYEYQVNPNLYCLETSEIVSRSKVNEWTGRISPNIYVGTLNIGVLKIDTGEKCGTLAIEVQSVKTNYREDYRQMLEEITEKCTELLLQHNSPASQYFEVDFEAPSTILYQRFAFIKSILESAEFNDAVHKIVTAPVTKWEESEIVKDIRQVKRLTSTSMRQIASASNRIDLPETHSLKNVISTLPTKIRVRNKKETADTAENRFVKHALIAFQTFCSDFVVKLKNSNRIQNEANLLVTQLEQYLSHSVFKEISELTILPLNSPVLQRKEGYRDILRIWLMFDLAAKMIWHGGDDVYRANKKDVAVLYEYWLFFKLLDIIKEVFKIDYLAIEELIEKTEGEIGLRLKQGKFLPIKGIYESATRKLNIEFSYNKTFSGGRDYPSGGSWTRSLRPDYTLSVWPHGIEQEQAEEEELIVHIHFDAKYKVEEISTILGGEDNLDEEKEDQKMGTYKHADILKMHTYRDAIRRTAGAYVLYPGTVSENKNGFHEILPGLGAFAIRPSKTNSGTDELKIFLKEVVTHFMNRASQREKISLKTYETYKDNIANEVNEQLPETYGVNRKLIPDETYVLVAYYHDQEHLDWIIKYGLYNARIGPGNGSLRLRPQESNAHYILLRKKAELITSMILKIKEKGPRVFSKEQLMKKGYKNPSQDFYLVYDIEPINYGQFEGMKWDVRKLDDYKTGSESAYPFSVSMSELTKAMVK
jgi:predicted component of viral defense system (DUF524 family)